MIPRAPTAWDLWILRALDPEARPGDVTALRDAQRQQAGWETAARARLLAGDPGPVDPGRRLLAARPELKRGLILTLQLGPFPLVLDPFLAAGLPLTVVADRAVMSRLGPDHRGRVHWLAAGDPDLDHCLLDALGTGGPVLAFADTNPGRGDPAGARRRVAPYRLPGREIRPRADLARIICWAGCPVHPLRVRWQDGGESVDWSAEPTQRWGRGDDPATVAGLLLDWVFAEVAAAPRQWTGWELVGETAACFAPLVHRRAVPPGLQADYRRAFLICLSRAAATVHLALDTALEIWPGDVLADLGGDRFYTAEGLTRADLALLAGRPTLAELLIARGDEWVAYHGLRLCLLGVARLSGAPSSNTP